MKIAKSKIYVIYRIKNKETGEYLSSARKSYWAYYPTQAITNNIKKNEFDKFELEIYDVKFDESLTLNLRPLK